jgi:hypothetical protein
MTPTTLFRLLLVLTAATLVALAVIDSGLKVPSSPLGIMSFEFCGFSGSCAATLAAWGEPGRQLAMLSLGLDYLFLLLYPGLICLALLLLLPRLPARQARMATLSARLAWLIALADAVENFFLVQVIRSGGAGAHGDIAAIFASLKFLVLFLTLAALLHCWRRAQRSAA